MNGADRRSGRYLARVLVTDIVALLVAGVATLAFGTQSPSDWVAVFDRRVPYPVMVLAGIALWVLVAAGLGAYDRIDLGGGSEEFRRVVLATAAWLGIVALLAFLTVTPLSRAVVGSMAVLGGITTLLGRDANRRWLFGQRSRGIGIRRVLVHGTTEHAEALSRHLEIETWSEYQVVATSGTDEGQIRLDLSEPLAALHEADADTLAVTDTSGLGADGLRTLAEHLEGTGCRLLVVPSLTQVAGPRIRVRPVSGLPLLHLEEPRLTGPARLTKAVMDRALSLVLLVLLALPLAILMLAIRLTSSGPALFRQTRVGLDGRPFTLYKLRTMVVDAEAQLEHLRESNEADGPLFKVREDPRVTRLGGWLRRHSVDELPQLANVLRGQMSLVGPRPMLPSEVEELTGSANRRLLVKPGVTGLWQVSGRSNTRWTEAVRLDLYYVENWSLSLDLVILARTALAVIQGRGAF